LTIRTAEVKVVKILHERDNNGCKIRENSQADPGRSALDFSPIAPAIGI